MLPYIKSSLQIQREESWAGIFHPGVFCFLIAKRIFCLCLGPRTVSKVVSFICCQEEQKHRCMNSDGFLERIRHINGGYFYKGCQLWWLNGTSMSRGYLGVSHNVCRQGNTGGLLLSCSFVSFPEAMEYWTGWIWVRSIRAAFMFL